jgi:hypothetical protein
MAISHRHILQQGPVLQALGQTAWQALRQRMASTPPGELHVPGPEFRQQFSPLPADLLRDYIRHVGGDPAAYRGMVPAHLFPQWGFPLAARTLSDLPFPLLKVMNGGCRIKILHPLPANEPLIASARLVNVDNNGRRAVLQQHIVTGTKEPPESLIADLFAIVPLPSKDKQERSGPRPAKEQPRVSRHAKEIAFWKIPAHAGLDFAKLTGDFNPIHWVEPYAKLSGFRHVILHGFSTMARTAEGLIRGVYAGNARALTSLDVKFTKPLVLPARVGLYIEGNQVWVGDAPDGPAYLSGTFNT